ncbi:hypothetical protein CONPUDRAFT_158133 [Coniophora puteana RWD-64-598 SS2]|uniref:Uncharacterized protein n=1 Tax=Coniophora puteana (strain RWD-64-598) TaxID=741705 RepID=A0A5M3MBB7_CONPW|nr:uncharacterized protein CONPUDRAFT_158133 [Coniophora puteana RWD-64-598 SS2]EIW76100.1 hypothetical protein CONPUDRAFT_158133 [Coniophora puteana RWD-64-598 SS2]
MPLLSNRQRLELEGYRSQPASAAPTPFSSPTKPSSSAVTVGAAAPSANETLRDVFSVAGPGRYTPTSSPSKRRHIESSDDEGDFAPPLKITDEETSQDALQGRTINADVSRTIRPMRRVAPGAGAYPPAPGLLKFKPVSDHQRPPRRTRGVVSDVDVFLDPANAASASEDEMECCDEPAVP